MQLLWVKSYCTCTWLSGQLENSPSFHGDAAQGRWNKMGQGGRQWPPPSRKTFLPLQLRLSSLVETKVILHFNFRTFLRGNVPSQFLVNIEIKLLNELSISPSKFFDLPPLQCRSYPASSRLQPNRPELIG